MVDKVEVIVLKFDEVGFGFGLDFSQVERLAKDKVEKMIHFYVTFCYVYGVWLWSRFG